MAIRPARLEPLALSASGHERMVNGRAVASGEKSIGFSARIAWFGDILNIERDRSSRSGPVRSLSIQSDGRCEAAASGGGSVPGLNPLVLASWSVGRENSGQVDVGATHVSRLRESG